MKKVGIIAAVVILLLVLGVGGFLFMKYSKAPAMPQTQTSNTQPATGKTANSVSGSLLSLLSGGQTVTCTFTIPDNKGMGTVFVSDQKFAGDFTTKGTDGKDIASHVVSDGVYMYIWSANMPTGIKVKFDQAKQLAANAQSSQNVNLNQNVDMKCGAWLPDNSKFAVPTNVQFRDMSQLLQQAMPSTATAPKTGTGAQTASPCDQIADPNAKAACVRAMSGQGY